MNLFVFFPGVEFKFEIRFPISINSSSSVFQVFSCRLSQNADKRISDFNSTLQNRPNPWIFAQIESEFLWEIKIGSLAHKKRVISLENQLIL